MPVLIPKQFSDFEKIKKIQKRTLLHQKLEESKYIFWIFSIVWYKRGLFGFFGFFQNTKTVLESEQAHFGGQSKEKN